MTAPRPRRLFQFHLSTAIVLMFTGAFLVALNIYPWPRSSLDTNFKNHAHGWPVQAVQIGDPVTEEPIYLMRLVGGYIGCADESSLLFHCIMVDAVVAVFILTCVTVLVESLIRRREARKP